MERQLHLLHIQNHVREYTEVSYTNSTSTKSAPPVYELLHLPYLLIKIWLEPYEEWSEEKQTIRLLTKKNNVYGCNTYLRTCI